MNFQDGEYRVTVNGIGHWYRVAGAAQGTVPIVVVHGGPGGNCYNFERTIGPRLESFATLIYYEQRGSGRSEGPPSPEDYSLELLVSDLEALRQHWELERMTLLGFSFGGELALEYALSHPERVHKLILQAPSRMNSPEQNRVQLRGFWSVARGQIRQEIEAVLAGPGTEGEKFEQVWKLVDRPTTDCFLFQNPEAARLNRELWREAPANTGDMYRALLKQPRDPLALLRRLPALSIPTLLMIGLYDRNVGVDWVRDLASALPDSRLEVFLRSAHFPDLEESERYAGVVRGFL